MKKNDLIKLTIEKYAFEGKGIAKIDLCDDEKKFIVFVEGAYPGDQLLAKVIKKKKSFADAKIIELLEKSSLRTEPRCKYFGTCGGCKQQNLFYKDQLIFKQEQVDEIYQRLGGFSGYVMEEIIPSKNIFFYRNKMDFSFADKKWLTEDEIKSGEIFDRDFALGLHIPNMFDKVLDIDECFLQSELSNRILNFTREFFKTKNTSIYTTKTHSGYLRNLVIKQASNTNDLMVNLVTSNDDDELMMSFTSELTKAFPEITTFINNINTTKALIAVGNYEKIFFGDGYIYDKIGKYKFRISANSFFQTSTLQAENLYQKTLEFCEFESDEIVYDLYSGAGTISIFVSEYVKNVFGFEVVDSSVKDAELNREINNISNVYSFKADLYSTFLPLVKLHNLPNPTTIILDPPRSGMHANTVNDVINLSPKKIVYVSCNPTTQVRDLKLFADAGYQLIKICPVDMFPHTYHIETVALLRKI